MKTLKEIRPIKEVSEADILKRPGVTGVDIGYKYVGGKKTDELSIRVFVEEKKDVPKKERIDPTIEGIKTDVIRRKFVLHPLSIKVTDLEIKADRGRYNPLKGGISIGPCRVINGYVFVGTLGAIVKDNDSGDTKLLSNFHVMCVDDKWKKGDKMAQPGLVDGGECPYDIVGELQRASLGEEVDCAIATPTTREITCEIVDIGEVTGISKASESMSVRKRGRTTKLTYGIVDTVDLTVKIDYGDGLGEVTLKKQIGIEVDSTKSSQFGNSGDSGSVVINDEREVVGLYFAGTEDGTHGVANPIQAVLDALNVSIFTEGKTGNITGKVIDKVTGDFIEKVEVYTDTGQSTETGADGNYELNNVPIGEKIIHAYKEKCRCVCTAVTVEKGSTVTAKLLKMKCEVVENGECIIADCAEGLGKFDNESGSYPVIDKQELYNGKPTCKTIDVCGIQAHAGYYLVGSGGKKIEINIEKCPYLNLTMKAEKDTDTCLLLMVHDKKPYDHKRRFVVVGKTPKGNCGSCDVMDDFFTITDDGQWHEYSCDLRKLQDNYPDAETIRIAQFYSNKNCDVTTHTFNFSKLIL